MVAMIFKVPPHWEHCSMSIKNIRVKALPGFRPSDRRSPFKTAPRGFVSSGATSRAGAAEAASYRDPLRGYSR